MTPRDLAYEALSYIAPSGSPANEATLTLASARQKARLAADLTAAMQEIYELAPAIYRRTLAATLAAPQTIELTVTDGSVDVTTVASFAEGATLLLGERHNQIFTENGQARLLFPFLGNSGTVAGTLYTDCVPLGNEVSQVLDQVYVAGGRRLAPAHSRGDFLSGPQSFPDYGHQISGGGAAPSVGQPHSYWVEDFLLTAGANHASRRRLRLLPLPATTLQVSYDVRLRAPSYAAADLGDDSTDATRVLVVANDYHESLVRPLFLQRWSGSPWFRDETARQRLEEDATRARARLAEYYPQPKRNRRLTAPI
jgi:hypothetical protein